MRPMRKAGPLSRVTDRSAAVQRRVDARFAACELRCGIGTRGERADGATLGGRPRLLAPRVALRQQPFLAQLRDGRAALRRVVGRTVHVDRHALNDSRLSRPDDELDAHRFRRSIDPDVDFSGEESLRGGGFLRLRHGIAREAVEEILRHVLVVLPADEVDRAAQGGGDVAGRDDVDAITDRVVGVEAPFGAGGRRRGFLRATERG